MKQVRVRGVRRATRPVARQAQLQGPRAAAGTTGSRRWRRRSSRTTDRSPPRSPHGDPVRVDLGAEQVELRPTDVDLVQETVEGWGVRERRRHHGRARARVDARAPAARASPASSSARCKTRARPPASMSAIGSCSASGSEGPARLDAAIDAHRSWIAGGDPRRRDRRRDGARSDVRADPRDRGRSGGGQPPAGVSRSRGRSARLVLAPEELAQGAFASLGRGRPLRREDGLGRGIDDDRRRRLRREVVLVRRPDLDRRLARLKSLADLGRRGRLDVFRGHRRGRRAERSRRSLAPPRRPSPRRGGSPAPTTA